jgi:hypothetical protein
MAKPPSPIFSFHFLEPYLENFRLDHLPGIFEKKEIIKNWQDQLKSGKVTAMTEIELKSIFSSEIIGKVLGFNRNDPYRWSLREEFKVETDTSRADAAMGIFSIYDEEIDNEVRIVVEVKRAGTDLDKPQNRIDTKNSPVEQAFLYATKAGNKCRWVIVTNFEVIRFYHASYQGEFQSYFLKDLLDEKELKSFLFLFRQEQLMSRLTSPTDKLYNQREKPKRQQQKLHILDDIFNSLYRFDELPFLEPEFIANLYPFNILNEEVWHYGSYQLYTLNTKIYHLLKRITVEDQKRITIEPNLQTELQEHGVTEPDYKIGYIFQKLSDCLIFQICCFPDLDPIRKRNGNALNFSLNIRFGFEADEGLVRSVRYHPETNCNCSFCLYDRWDINGLIRKLKVGEGRTDSLTFDGAYGNYLLPINNYKNAYLVYKGLEDKYKGVSGHAIAYFLVKYNLKELYYLIGDYQLDDRQQLLDESKAIDLDHVLYQEIDIFLDENQIRYLQRIKEQRIVRQAKDQFSRLLSKIKENRENLRNGTQWSGGFPDQTDELEYQHYRLYAHYHGNLLIGHNFSRYSEIIRDYAEALIVSYLLPTEFKAFTRIQLSEFIWHLSPNQLKELVSSLEVIILTDHHREELVDRMELFLQSNYETFQHTFLENRLVGHLRDNFTFSIHYEHVFSNIFILLQKVQLSETEWKRITNATCNHLKVSPHTYQPDTGSLADLIKMRGNVFTQQQLYDLLALFLINQEAHRHPFESLGLKIPTALKRFYPDFSLTDRSLIKKALANCTASNGYSNYQRLIPAYAVCNDACKSILKTGITEFLDESYQSEFYKEALTAGIFNYRESDYFAKLILSVNRYKPFTYQGLSKEITSFNNFEFFNFSLMLYRLNIKLDDADRALLSPLTPYECWLIDPENFEYKEFDPRWLRDAEKRPMLIKRYSEIPAIANSIERYLTNSFDEKLSELYFRFLGKQIDEDPADE